MGMHLKKDEALTNHITGNLRASESVNRVPSLAIFTPITVKSIQN